VTPATRLERAAPWLLRLTWIGVLVAGGAAVDGATAGRSDAVAAVAHSGGGVLWLAGVATMAVPAVVSLTAMRILVPLVVPTAVVSWLAGADDVDAALFLAVGAVATVVALSAEIGRTFVQASAYGEEDRFLLRAPPAYALAAALAWSVWAAAVVAGPLLLAARNWFVGGAVGAVAIAGAIWGWPRWHRLSRRWLVFVPIGVVIHDHLVLAETVMIRRGALARLRLAPVDTEAGDLTGPAGGHAVEITTTESITAIPAGTEGAEIHLTACLVGPSRPGRTLEAAARRRLAVG
jgi:hypothetical protein